MKISINDECGSNVTAVLTLNGDLAIEGQDYVKWEGKYHKNGKWSYSEGGIGLKNGAYAVFHGSTHSSANGQITFFVVKEDHVVHSKCIGKLSEAETEPHFEGEFSDLLKKLFEAHLNTRKPENVLRWRERWKKNEAFF